MKDNSTRILFSNPTFSHTTDKVTIHIFYYVATYRKNQQQNENNLQKNILTKILISVSKSLAIIFQKEVCFTVTQIHYPYLNANIFSQYIGHNSSSNTFVHFYDSIVKYPSLFKPSEPIFSYISGIKIKVSGRLATQRSLPRVTTKSAIYGSFKNIPVVDYGKYTLKNYMGTFTIKV